MLCNGLMISCWAASGARSSLPSLPRAMRRCHCSNSRRRIGLGLSPLTLLEDSWAAAVLALQQRPPSTPGAPPPSIPGVPLPRTPGPPLPLTPGAPPHSTPGAPRHPTTASRQPPLPHRPALRQPPRVQPHPKPARPLRIHPRLPPVKASSGPRGSGDLTQRRSECSRGRDGGRGTAKVAPRSRRRITAGS